MRAGGVLFRTNHVVSDQLSHFNPPEENYPSTHKRYDRIAQMVEERYGSLRFQDLYRIMSDHTNEPNCICRHPHEGVPATTVSTHPLRGRGPRGVDYAAKSPVWPCPMSRSESPLHSESPVPGSGPGTHRPFSLLVPNIKKWSAEILLTIFLFRFLMLQAGCSILLTDPVQHHMPVRERAPPQPSTRWVPAAWYSPSTYMTLLSMVLMAWSTGTRTGRCPFCSRSRMVSSEIPNSSSSPCSRVRQLR